MFLRELWHPFPFALFLWHIGRLPEEDARDIRRHLEEDECAHCTALIRRMAWASEPVRVPAGAFPDTIPSQEFVSEDGQLRVVIQQDEEAAPGGVVLTVEVGDGSWTGGDVLVTLTDEEGIRPLWGERMALERREGDLWEGCLVLTPERVAQWPERVQVWVHREEPER